MLTPEEYQNSLQEYQLYIAAYNGIFEERSKLIDNLTRNRALEREYHAKIQTIEQELKQYELMMAIQQRENNNENN